MRVVLLSGRSIFGLNTCLVVRRLFVWSVGFLNYRLIPTFAKHVGSIASELVSLAPDGLLGQSDNLLPNPLQAQP